MEARSIQRIVELLALEDELELATHPGWACVAERFGTRAVLVTLATVQSRQLSWENYHAHVSSYSIGLVVLDGRTVLIVQTQ